MPNEKNPPDDGEKSRKPRRFIIEVAFALEYSGPQQVYIRAESPTH